MRLSFLGGVKEIGRSCLLVEDGESKLLVDCGSGLADGTGPQIAGNLPSRINAAIVTHAHNDHWGSFPYLFQRGFRGPVYMTKPTFELIRSFGIPETLKFAQKSNIHDIRSLQKNIDLFMKNIHILEYGQQAKVKRLKFTLLPASHVIGSSQVLVSNKNDQLLVTSDISPRGTFLLPPSLMSKFVDKYDIEINPKIVVIEATNPERNSDQEDKDSTYTLVQYIRETFARGGNVLVPSFAVGRAQEFIVRYLSLAEKQQGIFPIEIFQLGAVSDISQIYYKHKELLRDPCLAQKLIDYPLCDFEEAAKRFANDFEILFNRIVRRGLTVLVASGGMLFGSALKAFLRLKDDKSSLLLLIGYQAPGTSGFNILKASNDSKIRERLIFESGMIKIGDNLGKLTQFTGNSFDFRIRVTSNRAFSAHGDRQSILDYSKQLIDRGAGIFFTVHGDAASCESLSQTLESNFGVQAFSPKIGEFFEM